MSIFRADLYVKIKVFNYDLMNSTSKLFESLKNSSALKNIQMTKVKKDIEELGKTTIEEWYEITGSIDVPEGGKSFWVLSKNTTKKETYNFFMRIDRNIEAKDYNDAQNKNLEWAKHTLIKPIENEFNIEELKISSPVDFSEISNSLRDSK